MRAVAILLFSAGLLGFTGAHATTTQGDLASVAPVIAVQSGVLQLAGSFQNSTAKLADKSLGGFAGGFYGIGGSEPQVKYFKNKKKKIPRCCAGTSH